MLSSADVVSRIQYSFSGVCRVYPRSFCHLPQHTNISNHGQRQQQANARIGAYPRGFHPLGKGNPEQERMQYRVWCNGGQGFPWVLWHDCYCCVEDLGKLVPAGYGPDWRNGKAPSLVPLFHEGIPKARCHVRCGWWFGRCHRPQNSSKINLAIYWSDRWAHFRCGESFVYALWQKITSHHQSDDSLFCSRLFLRIGKRVAVSTTASSALTAPTAASPSKVRL